jgi:hypothetical protein
MSVRTWKEIKWAAIHCKQNVERSYTLGMWQQWGYYFAKAIITPYKDIKRNKSLGTAPRPHGDYVSNQIKRNDYIRLAKDLIKFCENPDNNRMPNYLEWNGKKLRTRLYVYVLAQALAYFNEHKEFPSKVNANYKAFYPPKESTNEVYAYFKKVFGDFGDTIDGALSKIDGNGYGGYSDDRYSNKTSIDRMHDGEGINYTDSCHVFYNIMLELIQKGKYRKVECLHVGCSSGTGHVRLRITLKDGDTILRDPASVLDGNGVTSNWCTSNYELWGIDPDWFMANLHR